MARWTSGFPETRDITPSWFAYWPSPSTRRPRPRRLLRVKAAASRFITVCPRPALARGITFFLRIIRRLDVAATMPSGGVGKKGALPFALRSISDPLGTGSPEDARLEPERGPRMTPVCSSPSNFSNGADLRASRACSCERRESLASRVRRADRIESADEHAFALGTCPIRKRCCTSPVARNHCVDAVAAPNTDEAHTD